MNKYTTYRHEKGFSLLELMISIALGLLVVAAAMQIITTSQSTVNAQLAASDLQDDGIFGLSSLYKSLRMINYGARSSSKTSKFYMNDQTLQGGIVLTMHSASNDTNNVNLMGVNTARAVISMDGIANSSNVTSNTGTNAIPSSRLVVQRQVDEDEFDCMGNTVPAGNYLVESYFVRADANMLPGEVNPLSFVCTAANYEFDASKLASKSNSGNNEINLSRAMAGNGEVLIDRVDYFGFLLGVQQTTTTSTPVTNIRYMTVTQYNALPAGTVKPKIVTLKIGLITRSSSASNAGKSNGEQRFTILGQKDLKLVPSVANGQSSYQRQALEKTIFIRNARG